MKPNESDVESHLVEWLNREHNADVGNKAKRLRYIRRQFGKEGQIQVFFGGPIAKDLFEEARWSYVNGQFIACLLLCQSFFEADLTGQISHAPWHFGMTDASLEAAGFAELIDAAELGRIISPLDARTFHWLRKTRRQYVHVKPAFSKKNFMKRVVHENRIPYALHKRDARKAIKIILNWIQQPPHRI